MNDLAKSSPVDDDDNVSVTSTVLDDENDSWIVEKILTEKRINGEIQYLVEWRDKPLSQAEWMPQDVLIEDAVAAWERQKIQQSQGLAPTFQLAKWQAAATEFVRGEFSRREARNRKRQRLGLPQTVFEISLESVLAEIRKYGVNEEAEHSAGDLHGSHIGDEFTKASPPSRPASSPTDTTSATTLSKRKEASDSNDRSPKKLRVVIPIHQSKQPPQELTSYRDLMPKHANQKAGSASAEGVMSPALSLSQPAVTDRSPATVTPSIMKSSLSTKGKKKAKKVVRWVDTPEEHEIAPRKLEDSLFVHEGKTASIEGEPTTTGVESVAALLEPAKPQPEQDINARAVPCILSTNKPTTVTLMFDGIARHPNPWWLVDLESQTPLRFTHTCLATDFRHFESGAEYTRLREGWGNLVEGVTYALTETEGAQVRKLADWMRIGELGWISHRGLYCIVVFPSMSENWRFGNANESGISYQHPLRYWVFKPSPAIATSIPAPRQYPALPDKRGLFSGIGSEGSGRPFGNEYNELIPWGSKKVPHNFFLAFPEPRAVEASWLTHWLQECHPDCRIGVSIRPGQWEHFSKQDNGVIILHEDAVSSVRRFPDLHVLLHRSSPQYGVWIFTRSFQPVFDQLQDSDQDQGKIRLVRAFPRGMVMCITPSFLLSQPEQAYELFKWYWAKFFDMKNVPMPSGKIVVCADIEQWLLDLIAEKSRFRAKSQRLLPEDLASKGINDKALDSRVKMLRLVQTLAAASADDEDGPLVFAPESIDGDDEQSLVNWFGWWSRYNMGRFRKFSVVGSGNSHPDRLTREGKEVRYLKGTMGDPDASYDQPTGGQGTISTVPRTLTTERHVPIETSLTRILIRVRNDRIPVGLFKKPVSYWNSEMAFHFRDYYSKDYASYDAFLGFFAPFIGGPSNAFPLVLPTHAGIFCTTEGTWDAQKTRQDSDPVRRPWIAIHRPVNLHRKPWSATELLIWDVSCRGRFSSGEKAYEQDLGEGQRQLIEAIKKEKKNACLPLTNVWLGGFEPTFPEGMDATEATIQMVELLIDELQSRLPVQQSIIPEKGWIAVEPGTAPEGRQHLVNEDTIGQTMIFHPPRRLGIHHDPPAKCPNLLHMWTINHRRHEATSLYRFRPTMTWYSEQQKDKRSFEHIKVASWDIIFDAYGINIKDVGQ